MKQMTFLPAAIVCEIGTDETVLEVAIKNKIEINNSCGGSGTCGTCLVQVIKNPEGVAVPLSDVEQEMAADRGFRKNERLACQLVAINGLKVNLF